MDYWSRIFRNMGKPPDPNKRPKPKRYDNRRRFELYGEVDDPATVDLAFQFERLGLTYTWEIGEPQCQRFDELPAIVYIPENRRQRVYQGLKRCLYLFWLERRRRNQH